MPYSILHTPYPRNVSYVPAAATPPSTLPFSFTMVKFDFSPERDVPSLAGKVILITGGEALSLALALAYDPTDIFLASGTAGIGAETILQLAPHNPAHIYFTGRNANAATAVEEKVPQLSSH